MNKVLLTGRITKDPEIRYTQTGMSSLRFSVAVDRNIARDANGNRQTDFINCVAFSQQADFMSRYVHKGNMLCIEGRLQTGQYQNQQGQTVYTTDVVVERVENLTPRTDNQQPSMQPQQQSYQQNAYQGYNNPTYGQPRQQQPQPSYQAPQNDAPGSFDVGVSDDDLPF